MEGTVMLVAEAIHFSSWCFPTSTRYIDFSIVPEESKRKKLALNNSTG
jgi:hypothetical protein